MFKIVLAGMLLFMLAKNSTAQSTEERPLFERFPGYPPLMLLLKDSSTVYTEKDIPGKRPTLLIVFSPDCDHCQKEIREILAQIGEFKKINIVMATPLDFGKMKTFIRDYQLDQYKNIVVGQDTRFLLTTYYKISMLPFMAFYNKKGVIIEARQGNMGVDEILKKFE